ncbi:hypothetical protein JX265_003720 [Neoarthrinium moseri]|uniref:F-box domain-containing protein n=1 Tax=Neoarthrinium moseri TaxID=1658444 RepID=A0A9Q0APH8_9PEZI|nr:hypothetical protein JX265_003720 [Neoarthrinium moseri]
MASLKRKFDALVEFCFSTSSSKPKRDNDSTPTSTPTKAKPPQKARPGGSSLIILGRDITALIMDELQRSSPGTLSSVALVSSYYHVLARYSQHRDVTVRLDQKYLTSTSSWPLDIPAESSAHLLWWLNQAKTGQLLPAIHRLTVRHDRYQSTEDSEVKQAIEALCKHLPEMSGLTDLTWDGGNDVPDPVVQALSGRPALRLHVNLYPSRHRVNEEKPHKQVFSGLMGLTNLTSLKIKHIFVTDRQCLDIMQPLKDVLLSCKTLRKLSLDIHQPRSGCSHQVPPSTYVGLGFVDGQRPAALRELELRSYPSRNYPNGREMNYWATTFDWSQLERLVVSQPELAHLMLPYLQCLRHVEFPISSMNGLVQDFCSRVPESLESISVASVNIEGLDALLRHGPTLRTLRIHQVETYEPEEWRNEAVSESIMRRIRGTCTVIEELEVDIGRDGGKWPYAMLDIIASFPRLRRLKLWFELGVCDESNPMKPYVTAFAARHLFDYLLSRSTARPSQLRSIEINSGSPPPIGFGLIRENWPRDNSATFRCSVSERDDDGPQRTYAFDVEGLTRTESQCFGEGDPTVEVPSGVHRLLEKQFLVARDGPSPPQ